MSRLIFILAVVALVYWLLKSYRTKPTKPDASTASEEMVRCVHCGVHLPKSESLWVGGEYFCSDAHRRERAARSK
jgi:uncharacterized protein